MGAPEDEVSMTAPKKIDGDGSIALVNEAAKVSTAQHSTALPPPPQCGAGS